jgi:hypothetical protein
MGALKTAFWIILVVATARILPSAQSSDSVVTSIAVSVSTGTDGVVTTKTNTVVTTYTSAGVDSGGGTTNTKSYMNPNPTKVPPLEMPKKKDGMCQGDQAMGCAAAAAPAAMSLLPMLKGLGDQAKGDAKCGGGGGGKPGAAPDPASKCAREEETQKAKAKGKK